MITGLWPKPLTDQARRDVDPAAGGKTGDDGHWPRRIIVRRCELWKGWSGDNDPGKFKEFTAEKFHGAPPCGSKAVPIFVT